MHEVAPSLGQYIPLSALLAVVSLFLTWRYGFFKPLPKRISRLTWKDALQGFSLFLGMQFILLPIIFYGVLFLNGERHALPKELQGWLNLGAVVSLALVMALFCLLKWDKVKPLFTSGSPLKNILKGALSWFLAFPLLLVISELSTLILKDYLGFSMNDQSAVRQVKALLGRPLLLSFTVGMIVILVPFLEELLFRGFVQTALLEFVTPRKAILITSFFFALFHFSLSQGISNLPILLSLFLLSFFLGTLKEQQGNILGSIGLHATFNAISVAMILAQGAAS